VTFSVAGSSPQKVYRAFSGLIPIKVILLDLVRFFVGVERFMALGLLMRPDFSLKVFFRYLTYTSWSRVNVKFLLYRMHLLSVSVSKVYCLSRSRII